MARKSIPLEQKIKAAEEKVEKTKAKYDTALAELKELQKQYEENKKSEVFEALKNSDKSLDEIINFINKDKAAKPE